MGQMWKFGAGERCGVGGFEEIRWSLDDRFLVIFFGGGERGWLHKIFCPTMTTSLVFLEAKSCISRR